MPSRKPRIAITVPDDLKNDYDFVADQMGVTTTKLIIDVMEEAREQILSVGKAIEAMKHDPEKGLVYMKRLMTDVRQDAADAQLDLEDAIAQEKKRKRRK
tara:strand:- start:155 stop:454 length:300 start_codon:yes stop_codon:yes gene_type:complete